MVSEDALHIPSQSFLAEMIEVLPSLGHSVNASKYLSGMWPQAEYWMLESLGVQGQTQKWIVKIQSDDHKPALS